MSDFTPNQRLVLAAIGGGIAGGAVVAWLVGGLSARALWEFAVLTSLGYLGFFLDAAGEGLVLLLVLTPVFIAVGISRWRERRRARRQ